MLEKNSVEAKMLNRLSMLIDCLDSTKAYVIDNMIKLSGHEEEVINQKLEIQSDVSDKEIFIFKQLLQLNIQWVITNEISDEGEFNTQSETYKGVAEIIVGNFLKSYQKKFKN